MTFTILSLLLLLLECMYRALGLLRLLSGTHKRVGLVSNARRYLSNRVKFLTLVPLLAFRYHGVEGDMELRATGAWLS